MQTNRLRFKITALLLSLTITATAQKGDFDPNDAKPIGMVTPTPIDKMMAINLVLGKGKVNWKQVAKAYKNYLDVDKCNDQKVMLPIVMGFRMSDGVLSVMARDVEVLNAAAGDIESMAKKLGVGQGQLLRANKVRSYANKNQWNRVFLELGFLQKDVMDTMAQEGNKDRRALLIAGGWIQGAQMISTVVADNYSDDASALLREPLLVEQMIKDVSAIKPEKRKNVVVTELLAALKQLKELINVPLHAPIPKEKILEIKKITSQFTEGVIEKNS